jgi:DNA polymerase I-like protein with 3'-5' exonuclease and polymerase domains
MTELTDVVLDFETYYDVDYTLTKLTNIEYVLHPQFQVIGMAVKVGDGPAQWHTGDHEYLSSVLRLIDWSTTRLICHNALFDASILEWVFGFNPAEIFCTMMGSRPFVAPYTGSMSLSSVAKYLGCGEKGHDVENHKGRRREDFDPGQLRSYGEYCCNDSELTAKVAVHLRNWLPPDEQYLIHLTMMKYLRPSFRLDLDSVTEAQTELADARAELLTRLAALGVNEDDIRSRTTFTSLLKARGVVPPKKISKTTKKETFAYAKDDEEFVDLLTHQDPSVRTLVEARRELSSTLEAARLERFQTLWKLDLGGEHLMPIPLLYYAAHPGRFGGIEKINLQNLPRPDKKNPRKGALRRALRAPEGYSVLAADFSNIEARIVATLAGQMDLVAAFANGEDIYSQFASRIYGREILKGRDDTERFVGKMCILGLGYGMGWERFMYVMHAAGIAMSEADARRIVKIYRDTYPSIPILWATLEQQLGQSISPKAMFKWGPLLFTHERIVLPNNMPIIYPGLRADGGSTYRTGLVFDSKRKGARTPTVNHLWGGIITENVTQALARIIATNAEIRIARAGLPTSHQAHDELIWVVRTEWLKKLIPGIENDMCTAVQWLPNLPIAVEIHHGPTYGDCK